MEWVIWMGLGLMLGWLRWRKRYLGGLGWISLAGFWTYKLPGFVLIHDGFNALLSFIGIWICSWMGLGILLGIRDERFVEKITKPVIVVISIYFPFAQIDPLKKWLIGTTTGLSVLALGSNAKQISWNELTINGLPVEIILACTSIESIALFSGFILGSNSSRNRKLYGVICSVPVIYGLNLLRNWYVISAYGYSWYGDPLASFYISHHVISKLGSLLALILIAFIVFKLVPELLHLIQELISELRSHPLPWR